MTLVACSAGAETVARPPAPSSAGEAALASAGAPRPVEAPPSSGDAVIAPPPETFSGEAPPRVAPPVKLRAGGGRSGGTWAVIVGVNDYPGRAHDLKSAVADAWEFNHALATLGVPEHRRVVLQDGQVTAGVLRSALTWLERNAGPDATAVFFFAGHVRKLASRSEALVTANGGSFTDVELGRRLERVSARRGWIVIAGCYGGGFTETLRPGRILTGAAPQDKQAYENSAFGRSYLVEYMVRQGLTLGHAPSSVQAAFAYATEALARDYPDRQPVQIDQVGGPLDLRQAGYRAPSPPAGSAPQQRSAGGTQSSGSGGGGSTPRPTTTSTAPKDGCEELTLVVRCSEADSNF